MTPANEIALEGHFERSLHQRREPGPWFKDNF